MHPLENGKKNKMRRNMFFCCRSACHLCFKTKYEKVPHQELFQIKFTQKANKAPMGKLYRKLGKLGTWKKMNKIQFTTQDCLKDEKPGLGNLDNGFLQGKDFQVKPIYPQMSLPGDFEMFLWENSFSMSLRESQSSSGQISVFANIGNDTIFCLFWNMQILGGGELCRHSWLGPTECRCKDVLSPQSSVAWDDLLQVAPHDWNRLDSC